MRVVDRDTFLTLPPGTFYNKFYWTPQHTPYRGQLFDTTRIKGDTLASGDSAEADFESFFFNGVHFEESNTDNCEAILEDLAHNRSASYSLTFGVWARDSIADVQPIRKEDGPLFAVWERQDVARLILRATVALKEGYALDVNDNPFVEPIDEVKPIHPQQLINGLLLPEISFDSSNPYLSDLERAANHTSMRTLQWRSCAPGQQMFWFVFNYIPSEDLSKMQFGNEMSGSLSLDLIDSTTGDRVQLGSGYNWRAMVQELATYFDGQFVKQNSRLRTSFLDAKPIVGGELTRVYFTGQPWRDALDGRTPRIYLR